MDIQTKGQVGNLAAARFSRVQQEIDRVKNGIESNRKGELPLANIQGDPSKLAKRIAREGMPIEQALERINGVANFQDVVILRKMLRLAASVCRITIVTDFGSSGYGTGFLIAPDLIITNHHVFPDEASAKNSFIQFFYELGENGGTNEVIQFKLRPDKFFMTSDINKVPEDIHSGLDFTIVAVEEISNEGRNIKDLTPIKLDAGLGKIIEGENCIVIQHPQGDYKKIVLKDIRMLTLTDNHLIYESDTLPGSSGSMVVGLGTGEVVALHHSGVPRTNEQGQWLKKDGSVAMDDDADDAIDWIGNEGIRVSCILKAIEGIPVKDSMNAYKDVLLKGQTATPSNNIIPAAPAKPVAAQSTPAAPPPPAPAGPAKLLYFEITLSASKQLQADWKENAKKLVPGYKRSQVLFPFSTLPQHKRMFYLTVSSAKDPWALAAEIEALPHVDACTPDLPTATHMQESFKVRGVTESSALELGNDGTGEWNEDEFKKDWLQSFYCKDWIANNKADDYRQWNRKAINYPAALDEKIKNNLRKLKMIQLDTGYTDHTKVQGSYDFVNDADFVDNDGEAKDEQVSGLLKQPSHGTRTASLVTGCKIKNFQYDGNRGLLTENDKSLINLIPYRVAKSVILIGSGKNMVDAASHAINSNADVMYMCMGGYPRPMIEEIARIAYDRGVIWVCAAGNEVEMVIAPALYPGTIAVAAFNPDQRPWKGSSYGSTVDIAAPGEDVYVPFVNKKGEEVMVFGSGTSYATPQVASAAMLWKARWRDELGKKYKYPWQVVEAFRVCLKNSANNAGGKWDTKNYGAGILDVDALLKYALPEIGADKYAYKDAKDAPKWDLGIREGIHFIWNTLKKKLKPGQAESFGEAPLSPRALNALAALSENTGTKAQESTGAPAYDAQDILRTYFESNQ